MRRQGTTALTPVLITFISIAAFVLVMWFALDKSNTNTNANPTNTNAAGNSLTNSDTANVNDTPVANTNADGNANTNTDTSNSSYFEISEWGVEFPAPVGTTYVYAMDPGNSIAKFSTSSLESHDYCTADQSAIGTISRYSSPPTTGPLSSQTPIAIGDWYYYYQSPQATCSDDATITSQQTAAISMLRTNFSNLKSINDPTAGWQTFTSSTLNITMKYPDTYFVQSNQFGVTDPMQANALFFRKTSDDYSGVPSLDISTSLTLASGQNLQQLAQSIYDSNHAKDYSTTSLTTTSYDGNTAYEFGLQTGYTDPNGGRLLDAAGGKVVILQQAGTIFTFLQTGTDSVLAQILQSLKFQS